MDGAPLREAKNWARLQAEIRKLRMVCAEAYQLAGAVGAPVEALDNLSDAANGRPLRHKTFLPILEVDCVVVREMNALIALQASTLKGQVAVIDEQAAEIAALGCQIDDLVRPIMEDATREIQQAALIQSMREALKAAAHDIDCATDFGQRSYVQCNCWKSKLLSILEDKPTVKDSLTVENGLPLAQVTEELA